MKLMIKETTKFNMKLLLATAVLAVCLIEQALAVCPSGIYRGKVTFVLDVSEEARTKSSLANPYSVLRQQLQQFYRNVQNSGYDVSGVSTQLITYTGNLVNRIESKQSEEFTNLNTLINALDSTNSGQLLPSDLTLNGASSGGSVTFQGLKTLSDNWSSNNAALRIYESGVPNNIILVSAQGSFTESSTLSTPQQFANSNYKRGATPYQEAYVLAVNQPGRLDESGLQLVASALAPNNNNRYTRLDDYNQISASFLNEAFRDTLFCQAVVNTPAPVTLAPSTGPCSECTHRSGTYQVSHDVEGCTHFYECVPDVLRPGSYIAITKQCGPGTLYNRTAHNCISKGDYSCDRWQQCSLNQARTVYPDICCSKYYECQAGVVNWLSCPTGQIFDSTLNRNPPCRPLNAGETDCRQLTCSMGATPDCSSFSPVVGNRCKYNESGTIKDCAEGVAWNQETCACSDLFNCYRDSQPGVDAFDGRNANARSDSCAAYLHLDFENAAAPFVPINETSLNRSPANIWVSANTAYVSRQTDGATNFARYVQNTNNARDFLFIPFFANRMMPEKFRIDVEFRLNQGSSDDTIVLVSNDRCSDCNETLRITATRSGAAWDFQFWVRDVNNVQSSVRASQVTVSSTGFTKVQASVNLGAAQPMRMRVTPSSGVTVDAQPAAQPLAARVMSSECGFSIGQGRRTALSRTDGVVSLYGDISDFKVIECENIEDYL